MLERPKYKLVVIRDCEYNGQQFTTGDVLTFSESPYLGGGHNAWAQTDGNAVWELNQMTVPEAREVKKKQINSVRDAKESEPLPYNGYLLDFDPVSRERLNGAIQQAQWAALNSQPFTVTWRTYDNQSVDFTIADWAAIQTAIIVRVGTLHEVSRQLKDSLNQMTDVDTIMAVAWPE